MSEALRRMAPETLDHIFPGSWINANFDVWIGAAEDNQAWSQLLRARETYDETTNVTEERRALAFEELLIAEGSDWCWWYGPEHHSDNREEFDQLYRSHLANVYRFLNLVPPEELSRPILAGKTPSVTIQPSGAIKPTIDGEVTSYFEWLGAGIYRVDDRSGSMHGQKFLVKEVQYGTEGTNLYLRVDFHPESEPELPSMELRFSAQGLDGSGPGALTISFAGGAHIADARFAAPSAATAECAFTHVLEVAIPLDGLGVTHGAGVRFLFSLWHGGLPMEAVPQQGWLEMSTTNPAEMG